MNQMNRPGEGFVELVQELWSAENMLTKALPAMLENAQHLGLKKNIAHHLAETDQHKEALAAIAKQLDFSVEGSENEELKSILDAAEQSTVKGTATEADAEIIRNAIRVEQYEMKKYEELAGMARIPGYEGIFHRLMLTYEEERQANTKLHFLLKSIIAKTADIGELQVQ
jgi:ferritin-like metal-binding protein YciE